MEGSSTGASLAQDISGTEQQRDKRKKVAVIPANDMKEYSGKETRLHLFLIPTLDVETERSTRDGGRGPSLMSQAVLLAIFNL